MYENRKNLSKLEVVDLNQIEIDHNPAIVRDEGAQAHIEKSCFSRRWPPSSLVRKTSTRTTAEQCSTFHDLKRFFVKTSASRKHLIRKKND